MKEPISKLRQRAVGQRGRQAAHRQRKVPFKDGVTLAVLYNLAFLLCVVAAIIVARRGAGVPAQWMIRLTGNFVVAAFSILGMRVLLNMLAPEAMVRNSRTCLLCLVSLLAVALTAGVAVATGEQGWPGPSWAFATPFLYPYILAPMLATLLLGPKVGLAAGIGTSMLMAQFIDRSQGLLVLILGLLAAIVTPHLVSRRVRKRMQLLRVSLVASVVLTVGVYLFALIVSDYPEGSLLTLRRVSPVLLQAGACLLSGFGCALLALVALPVFEHLFGATSNITLQAFSDLGHPLIERLCQEAPGTYSHVITVATLSSVAADRIGANGLLARVASYFHDIGKLSTPALFIENTTPERNPHQTLKPTTSASWVRSHVKDGVVLAERYHLPPPVQDVLWEHHGTTLIAPFLHKAREQAREEEVRAAAGGRRVVVEESQFRYPGPRPSTRESAIIMLADSVEAAARSLNRPTPQAIESLVSGIVEAKLKDEQLDDCPLTLRELATVKKSFVSSLSTILHARIAYPAQPTPHETADDAGQDRKPEDTLPSES